MTSAFDRARTALVEYAFLEAWEGRMIGSGLVRGLGTTVVAVLGTLVFAAGCSSDTGGKGAPGSGTTAAGSASVPAAPSETSPPSGLPSTVPSVPAGGGGSTSAFCQDWAGIGTPDVSSATAITQLLSKLQKAAGDAPAEVKADMNTLVEVLQGLAGHSIDMSKLPSNYAPAVQHVVTYVATNCH